MTPLMKQYTSIKCKYPDAILLFRVGDFYESFNQDAETISKLLNIVLTKRQCDSGRVYLAGFPYTALDKYLPLLVRAGNRVAICDQLPEPEPLVKRAPLEVKRSFSPGEQSCLEF